MDRKEPLEAYRDLIRVWGPQSTRGRGRRASRSSRSLDPSPRASPMASSSDELPLRRSLPRIPRWLIQYRDNPRSRRRHTDQRRNKKHQSSRLRESSYRLAHAGSFGFGQDFANTLFGHCSLSEIFRHGRPSQECRRRRPARASRVCRHCHGLKNEESVHQPHMGGRRPDLLLRKHPCDTGPIRGWRSRRCWGSASRTFGRGTARGKRTTDGS